MNIIHWLDRIHTRHKTRDVNAIAQQLFEELEEQPVPANPDSLINEVHRRGRDDRPATPEEIRALVDVLALMPKRQRAVLELSMYGWTHPDIAQVLHITNAVCYQEHARAIAVLQTLEKRE